MLNGVLAKVKTSQPKVAGKWVELGAGEWLDTGQWLGAGQWLDTEQWLGATGEIQCASCAVAKSM